MSGPHILDINSCLHKFLAFSGNNILGFEGSLIINRDGLFLNLLYPLGEVKNLPGIFTRKVFKDKYLGLVDIS